MSERVLMVDNYDSFTYNLVQAFQTLGAEVTVLRNDHVTPDHLETTDATHLVVSPGPGHPSEAGESVAMIRAASGRMPVLGVCLGHQAIALAHGLPVDRADRLMHGKSSRVYHDHRTLYEGLPNPFEAGRYHSLAVTEPPPGTGLLVSAYTSEGEVMGLRHEHLAIEGVQFHPESILTPDGNRLIRNFLDLRERP